MAHPIQVRQANPEDAGEVASILQEAARWLMESGTPMWKTHELDAGVIAADVGAGLCFLAEVGGERAGTLKFQLEDELFWPEMPAGQACYLHRLAVRRKFAGLGVSSALLGFAVERARSLGRPFLRLDCESHRPRLRSLYERFGFRHHSDRQVGPYHVARYEYPLASESRT
jgi:GNAT superfamily N-acetyltransferase